MASKNNLKNNWTTMKRARKINAIAWAVIAVALSAWVTIEWHNQGCELKSLILASAFYTTFCAAIGAMVDLAIQER